MAGPAAAAASPHGTFRIAAPATPPTAPVTRLRNPGELLAALPYLIGFHPRDSLLFIAFGGSSGRRIELTQRVDLPRADDAAAVCGALAANTLRVSPAGVAVVVVGGDPAVAGGVPFGGPPPLDGAGGGRGGGPDGPRGARAVAHLGGGDRCRRGLGLLRRVRLPRSRARRGHHPVRRHRGRRRSGGPRRPRRSWRSSSRRRHRAASAAAHGCSPAPSTPGADLDALCEALGTAGPDGVPAGTDGSPRRGGDAGAAGPTGHALVENALADAAAGRLRLDDARVVALALALSDLEVRDAALARCAGAGRGRGGAPVGRARPGDAGSGGRRARGAAGRLRAAAR